MNLLLLATGFLPQYRALRCAATCGATVFVAGTDRARSLAISRFCQGFYEFPVDALSRDEGTDAQRQVLARSLQTLAQSLHTDMILPSDSTTTRFLSSIREWLTIPVFPVPDPMTFDRLDTKDRFAELCRQLDIPHPQTRIIVDREELARAHKHGALQLPAVAKPINRSGSIGVIKMTRDNAQAVIDSIDYAPILLQDFIEGQDVCLSFFRREGEPVIGISYTFDGDRYAFTNDERLLNLGRTVAATVRFNGIIDFDLRVALDGSIYLIECNPRCWFNMDVAMVAGANFLQFGLPKGDQTPVQAPHAIATEVELPRACLLAILCFRRPSDKGTDVAPPLAAGPACLPAAVGWLSAELVKSAA